LQSHSEFGEIDQSARSSPDLLEPLQSGIGSPLSPHFPSDKSLFFEGSQELTTPLVPVAVTYASRSNLQTVINKTPASKAAVFGMINAIAGIPALVAYAAIVFKHPAYSPFLDLLCKFFFISSALHQTVFCLMSTLPFAMGQVQDVGIIFLSAMGTSIADIAADAGKDADTALGTALLTMTLSTVIVGLGTLFVARRSLASFVHYVPLPVMGGYLGTDFECESTIVLLCTCLPLFHIRM